MNVATDGFCRQGRW